MSEKLLAVSLSPHTYTDDSVAKIMRGVILALVPAWLVSFWVFGADALRVTFVAVAAAMAFEYLIQKFLLKTPSTVYDGSAALTGLLLAFNVPAGLPTGLVILGTFVAIAIGKLSFGGLGNNPFNPALVGRVFLLISFPVHMTSWPQPFAGVAPDTDVTTTATPLAIIKEGLRNGEPMAELLRQVPGYPDLVLGRMAGSLGEISALALLLGGLYLLKKKIITWHIPVAVLGTVLALTGGLWLFNPERFVDPLFHLLSGGVILGAVYMATDLVTSPMTGKGMVIFGVGIGFLTVAIRVFGAYPEGISFAILMMNAFVPLINRFCKPKRFGE